MKIKNLSSKNYDSILHLIAAVLVLLITGMMSAVYAQPAKAYTNTVVALELRYAEEILAHKKYMAYSKQACTEGYPNIAHLFKALAASEGIHARNFSKLLAKLGGKADASIINDKITVKSTKYNLNNAAKVERDEIDREYPKILEGIRSEKHQQAITAINHAWKAEQQHRDLLIKLQRAGVTWFGVIVDKIEGAASHYHVCQVCGSTLTVKPKDKCPICGSPVSRYKTIAPLPAAACPVREEKELGN
jgi:rubrerythrin